LRQKRAQPSGILGERRAHHRTNGAVARFSHQALVEIANGLSDGFIERTPGALQYLILIVARSRIRRLEHNENPFAVLPAGVYIRQHAIAAEIWGNRHGVHIECCFA
jgi:hypothetical protein